MVTGRLLEAINWEENICIAIVVPKTSAIYRVETTKAKITKLNVYLSISLDVVQCIKN
jgi:hypothetical protein